MFNLQPYNLAVYSDNFGLECDQPTCAREKKCGPKNGGKVCGEGKNCVEDDHGGVRCKLDPSLKASGFKF